MATIQKRKNQNGSTSYRVMIRPQDGLPATYKTFPTFQEAKGTGRFKKKRNDDKESTFPSN